LYSMANLLHIRNLLDEVECNALNWGIRGGAAALRVGQLRY
jgi:hypothetical protein